MICPECNYDMDDSFMCPKCGFRAKEYHSPTSYTPAPVGQKPSFGLFVFLGILELGMCAPAGIIAIVFATIMKQRFDVGAYKESDQYKRYTKTTLLIGFLVSLISFLTMAFIIWNLWNQFALAWHEALNGFSSVDSEVTGFFTDPATDPLV